MIPTQKPDEFDVEAQQFDKTTAETKPDNVENHDIVADRKVDDEALAEIKDDNNKNNARDNPASSSFAAFNPASSINNDQYSGGGIRDKPHAFEVDAIVRSLNTNLETGLKKEDAAQRLIECGKNKLSEGKRESFFHRVWRQMNDILTGILFVTAIVCASLQSWPEFALILAVIFINVTVGLIQEGRASKATDALKNMLSTKAVVIRDGQRVEIDAQEVVPGDIVFVESGNKVPADLRVFEFSKLMVQESLLTGESSPVKKHSSVLNEDVGVGDRKNICFSATLVVKGQGKGICVNTGDATEIGKVAKLVSGVREGRSNLLKQIDKLGLWLGLIIVPIAITAFLIAYLTPIKLNGQSSEANSGDKSKAEQAGLIAVAVAVSNIPAGLPAIITITMAIATRTMARNNAIVKTLPSVEALGAVKVIFSDKTGTLTKNEMTAVAMRTLGKLYRITGAGYDPRNGSVELNEEAAQNAPNSNLSDDAALAALVKAAALNNDARLDLSTSPVNAIGDPTECALRCLAQKQSILNVDEVESTHARVGIIPFESDHKFMATFHAVPEQEDRCLVAVKGAPDRLLARCNAALGVDGKPEKLDSNFWHSQITALSGKGYRCLAFCHTFIDRKDLDSVLEKGASWIQQSEKPFLTFLGVVAIMDPPKSECIRAIEEAHRAGIIVKMVTGDHPATAKAIGQMLGLADDEHSMVLTGPEIDATGVSDLEKVIEECNIFSRASPDNKIHLVQASKKRGIICAMIGDGVNDAPALRAADIGVSMGITGSDVSKDAAKIILADDNFGTILVAVQQGRRVWDNLKKVVLFNVPATFAQAGVIFFSVCLQWDAIPLTAIQVLYVNMITGCTLGVILAVEPAEPTVMHRPPRKPTDGLVGKFFCWRLLFVATMFIVFILGGVSWIRTMDPARYTAPYQRAFAFNCLAFFQIAYVFNCRFLTLSSLHLRVFKGNVGTWICGLIVLVFNIGITYIPGLNTFFSMAPMDGVQWGIALLFAVCIFLLVEVEKAIIRCLKFNVVT